ncbi:MAG: hemin uptake protein HemP [Candidatus Loosdrechtia sp.]|uniref:hemin uptake protein HemP n=1 Tax=Candidatus Loosdrechtia sp. TaxID=3101272 RepID=UPI003A72C269|nr:MAG: hemin uptake protein HemP [Candidatus Jettenia sp. AMX2]
MQDNKHDKDYIIQSTGTEGKRIIRSEDIFQNRREVIIWHGTERYRLLITKAGKLILNK